jgi:hypothetical protein
MPPPLARYRLKTTRSTESVGALPRAATHDDKLCLPADFSIGKMGPAVIFMAL